MTVPNENKSNRYVATSGQTIFPYDFRIIDEDHIDVYQQGTLLTITTHYTVDGVGDAGGGNVTLVTGATLNDTVTLLRNVPLTQLTDYVENDAFPAETHENALDLSVMANQQRDEEVDRALKFGVDSTQVDFVLSEPVTGQYLRFTATGVDSATLADSTLAQSVDEADTDTTKDKMVSNGLAKGWEDYKDVGHLPLAGGAITGDTTVTAEFDITGGLGVTGDAQVDNININGNAITSTNTNGDIDIAPDGTGAVTINSTNAFEGRLNGLELANGTDATNDIDIATGVCFGSGGAIPMGLTATLTKQIDANWAVGSAAGGFPSGLTLTNDTTYHVFLIKRTDTGVVDAGFDTSLTAANLLSDATGYDAYRRIGSILYGTATILAFVQVADRFTLDVPVEELTGNGSTAGATLTLTTPTGIVTRAILTAGGVPTTTVPGHWGLLTPLSITNTTPSSSAFNFCGGGDGIYNHYSTNLEIDTDISSGIRQRVDDNTNMTWKIHLHGWVDYRGQN